MDYFSGNIFLEHSEEYYYEKQISSVLYNTYNIVHCAYL